MATAVRPAKQKKSRKHEQIKTPIIQYQSKDESVSLPAQAESRGEEREVEVDLEVAATVPNGNLVSEELWPESSEVKTEDTEIKKNETELRREEAVRVLPDTDLTIRPDIVDLSEGSRTVLPSTQYPDLTPTLQDLPSTSPLVALPPVKEVKPIYPTVPLLQSAPATDLLTPEMPAKLVHADLECDVREETVIPYADSLAAALRPFTEMELYSFCPTPLLDSNQVYVDSFVRRAGPTSLSEHPLYALLVRFQISRIEYLSALRECERMEQQGTHTYQGVWEFATKIVKGVGQCRDHTRVTRTHEYQAAEMSVEQLQTLEALSSDLRVHLLREVSLKAAHSEYEHLEIVSYLSHLLSSCEEYRSLSSEHPVRASDPTLLNYLTETQNACIRDCLSVLFIFERRPRKDDTFHELVRGWISSLLSHLLRTASYSDHLFTLNHLLRCPPGVGGWGAVYVQFHPLLALAKQSGQTMQYNQGYGLSPLSDHFLTMLATLLLPVKEREAFLKQLEIEAATPGGEGRDDPWIFVAEDVVEDDEEAVNKNFLVEEDLIAAFDQFPFTALFQYLLLDGGGGYSVERVSSHGLLTLVAFCSRLVELLGAGFSTFKLARYREFVKRLGRTVRYAVHLVSDHWLAYREHRMATGGQHQEDQGPSVPGQSVHSLQRIQVEMDSFVIRATKWILSSHKLGAWQFLADMPFETVSLEAVWKLFWLIHSNHLPITAEELIARGLGRVSGLKDILKDPDYREQFIDNVMRIPVSEAIFLFTTFANMALARDYSRLKDYEFIETVVLELMEVGFLNPVSRETYSRTARDLLGTIVLRHPQVVSILVQLTSEALFMMGDGCLFLFNALSFSDWLPAPRDLQVLTSWLIRAELGSNEVTLSQLVLGRMNWGRGGDGNLVLPASLHREVALAAVEACGRQIPKVPGNLGQEGVHTKGLRDVLHSYLSILSEDQQKLLSWSWKVVLLLNLHGSDVNPLEIGDEEEEPLCAPEVEGWSPHVFPLDLQHDASLVNLSHAVKTGGPLACYVALSVSMVGHETDLFCQEGVELLQVLMENRQYIPCMRVLKNVSPRFFEQKPDAAPPNLLKVIFLLTQADLSTASLTERWISGEGSKFNRCFCSLLQQQISERWTRGKQAGVKAFKFWVMTMISYPDWYKDKKMLSIVNALCEIAFNKPEMEKPLVSDLFLCVQSLPRFAKRGSRIQSVLSMVVGEQGPPSLLDYFSPQEHGWFAYYAMQAEERLEQETGIWKSLLSSLRKDPKQSFDSAIKNCATDLKLQNYPLWNLALYRWGKLSNELPKSHPVLPLCWQKFMSYFLQRPTPSGSSPLPSLGYLFFESYSYFSQHKTMRKTLQATHQHFKQLAESQGEEERGFTSSLVQYFQTMELWIDEPRLHEADLYLPALPPQYDQKRLAELVSNQFTPWMDLVNLPALEHIIRATCHEWTSCFEVRKPSSPVRKAEAKSAERRIHDRISLSDTPSPAPPLVSIEVPFAPVLRSCLSDPQLLLTEVKKDIRCLTQFYEGWLERMKDLNQMHNTLISLTPDLYQNSPDIAVVQATCKSSCTGACQIQFRFNQARKNESISQLIDTNLSNTQTLIAELKCPVPVEFSHACLRISRTISDLKEAGDRSGEIWESGRAMFYELLSSLTQKCKDLPATREFYYNSCQYLGTTFIAPHPGEAVVLLDQIFERIYISDFVVSLFRPDLATALDFLDMYAKINRLVSQHDSTIGATLMSKFDIRNWLQRQVRGSVDLIKLIESIFEGLKLKETKQDDTLLLLYISHLEDILKYDFPSLFSAVLHLLLGGGESGDLPTHPWKSFLDRLNARRTETGPIPGETLLTELSFISTHLMEQRITTQQTLYTIWQLYQQYLGAVITSLVETAIDNRAEQCRGEGDTFASEGDLKEIWDLLCDAYRPWVFPAQNPDGSTNIPWHLSESESSSMLIVKFVNSIVHVQQKLPARKGQPNILNHFWDTYSSQMALPSTPESILERLQKGFLSLHWDLFLPSLAELDSMLQLRGSKHTLVFLAGVFVKTKWDSLLLTPLLYPSQGDKSKALCHFLSLCATLLTDEYILKETEHAGSLLQLSESAAQQFRWEELPASAYQPVLDWLKENRSPETFLLSSSSSSVLAKLLQAAGGLPLYSLDTNSLSKQSIYIRFMVDNLSKYSLLPDSRDLPTKRAVSSLISLISSVSTSAMGREFAGRELQVDPNVHVTQLVSELLNVLNNSSPSSVVLKTSLDCLLNSLSPLADDVAGAFPGGSSQLLCIPTLTASCRSLAAMSHMVQVIETCVTTHFSGVAPPTQEDITGTDGVMLLPKESGYGWKLVCDSLTIPEMSEQEFVSSSVELGCCLTLFTRILLDLQNCRSLGDELARAKTLTKWCSSVKPSTQVEAKLILLIVQFFKLLMRQVRFGTPPSELLTVIASFDLVLAKFTEDKSSEGILGAIGLGKKSDLSVKFRLACRILQCFVYLQQPVDCNSVIHLRIVPRAPGHPKDPSASTRDTPGAIFPTKQTEQHLTSLTALGSNKVYGPLFTSALPAIDMVNDIGYCFVDCPLVFMKVVSVFYPDARYLDIARVFN